MILSGLAVEILVDISFYLMAIIKIQDDCRNMSGGSSAYQKWKGKGMGSMWKKKMVLLSGTSTSISNLVLSCPTIGGSTITTTGGYDYGNSA